MKACGIIVEYNPFHNGHAYHIEKAREASKAEVIVAVMSGNFLQRGEPAIIDKWMRTAEALKNGVDLVVELPFYWAVQSADYFARGGVKLLQALNCESLCFGTDSPSENDYQSFGEFTAANQQLIERKYKEINQQHLSYSRQMTQVFQELYPSLHLDFSSPNHILGLSYAKENAQYEHPMSLLPIKRNVSKYNEEKIHQEFASATAVRNGAFKGQWGALKMVIPDQTLIDLTQKKLVSWEDYWPLLKYRLISSSYEELQQIYQMTEGIEYRLKEKALKAETFHQFIESVKTKRYTWTRLQRLAVYILTNISAEEIYQGWNNSYLNILGMTEKGQSYLKIQKKKSKLPILTKQMKNTEKYFKIGVKCDRIYQLGNNGIAEQNSGRFPIRIKNA
ncbi:nucleotidyltransferase [Enterococcus sp. BWB1-3]|uniref:nucleotidyltransferase n=1 Tax=unclassified Enterococcus TaxID=2608891 RepID=UPI0019218C03|nr:MULTISPECIES: nucleotidyltransferase [unclassified Enterococcus]MBL1230832.1 nucleotidyltransferase [Enterococcus sp. BWB1-3]MCB5952187.1 nucleotidyltransferase [Enterococcus sp. BWT-B8]